MSPMKTGDEGENRLSHMQADAHGRGYSKQHRSINIIHDTLMFILRIFLMDPTFTTLLDRQYEYDTNLHKQSIHN